MVLWKHRGVSGKRGGRRRKRGGKKRTRTYTGGIGRNTVVPGGKIPRSIVTSKIGSGEFTRRVPI